MAFISNDDNFELYDTTRLIDNNKLILPDKIFYINLDRRQDRRNHIQNLLKLHSFEDIAERIKAVDGSKLNLDKIPSTIITANGIKDAKNKKSRVFVPLTKGAIGCAMSHMIAWQKIIDENLSSALIVEDDIRIHEPIKRKLHQYLSKAKELSFDILYLGYSPATLKYIIMPKNVDPKKEMFIRSKETFGLFAYIVSRKGAEKLLKIFPIEKQLDTAISKALKNHNINALLLYPEEQIITSDISEKSVEFGTDIQKREGFGRSIMSSPNDIFFQLIWFITIILCLYLIGIWILNE
jgi:GR25 family glycosyltransferase involved in LPS biosynthesis